MLDLNKIHLGDSKELLKLVDTESVDCIITSPPYWQLRDYGVDGQIGLESTVDDYICKLMSVFRECHRVLKSSGTLWIVIGDTYNGDKKGITDSKLHYIGETKINKKSGRYRRKTLLMIPSRLAIAMIDEGWILRNELIWHKPNIMPQSIKDRFTVDFEKIFFFTKSEKYYFQQLKEPMITNDMNSPRGSKGAMFQLNKGLRLLRDYNRTVSAKNMNNIAENKKIDLAFSEGGMRNKRAVWKISTEKSNVNHYATFPKKLVQNCMDSGCPRQGIVLDPFSGSGTTAMVAKKSNRNFLGIELNQDYFNTSIQRVHSEHVEYSIYDFIGT